MSFLGRKEAVMRRNLFVAFLLLFLMVCMSSGAWAGALDDVKAGTSAANRNDYDMAIGFFTKAIDSGELSRNTLSKVYFDCATAWGEKGDYNKAIADYTKAIENNPKYAEAYVSRGLAWGKKGDYGRSNADKARAVEINQGR
jgi:tetratricopeptide (TPR) repeat protein